MTAGAKRAPVPRVWLLPESQLSFRQGVRYQQGGDLAPLDPEEAHWNACARDLASRKDDEVRRLVGLLDPQGKALVAAFYLDHESVGAHERKDPAWIANEVGMSEQGLRLALGCLFLEPAPLALYLGLKRNPWPRAAILGLLGVDDETLRRDFCGRFPTHLAGALSLALAAHLRKPSERKLMRLFALSGTSIRQWRRRACKRLGQDARNCGEQLLRRAFRRGKRLHHRHLALRALVFAELKQAASSTFDGDEAALGLGD